jgi:hypothetical protein
MNATVTLQRKEYFALYVEIASAGTKNLMQTRLTGAAN